MALSDKDVDDTMAADWAEISAKYAPEPVEPPEIKADATPEPETTDKEVIPVSRDAEGKFKAQDERSAKVKAPAAQPKEPSTPPLPKEGTAEAQPQTPSDPQARDINRAPSTWKPMARVEFDKLSPTIKAEIHRREADFQNGQAQLLPDATLGKNMRAIIEPHRALIEAEGGTPERAVADLMRTAAIFRIGSVQAKYQAIAQIANQFGIDLRAFSGQPAPADGSQPQAQPQEFRDPRVDQLLAHQQQQEQQRQQREQQQLDSTVTRWMNEADAQGNPKRPYLNDVINEVSALIPSLQQADPTLTHTQALDAAYERAIWAHPEVRQLLTQKQQADLEAQRRTDNQARVRDARRAGSVNVPRRGSTPAPGKPGSMEETIAETARSLGMIS
jgi:hypothetical protein